MIAAILLPLLQGTIRSGEPVELALGAEDPLLEGHGRRKVLQCTTSDRAMLRVWATGSDLDPFLRISDASGSTLAEDEDSGGGTAAFLELAQEKAARLSITVAGGKDGQGGTIRVALFEVPRLREEDRPALEEAVAGVSTSREAWAAGRYDQARADLSRSIEALLALPRCHEVAEALWEAGGVAWRCTDRQRAKSAWEPVWRLRERTLPPDHAALQTARLVFAATVKELGEVDRARDLEERALEVCARTLTDAHPTLQQARENLAVTYCMQGDPRRGRALQEKALEVYSRTLEDGDPHVQRARMNLGITLKDLGDLPRARQLEESAVETLSRSRGDDDLELAAARMNLALTLSQLGDSLRERELMEKVLETYLRVFPQEDMRVQLARDNLAIALIELGEISGARDLFETENEIASRVLPPDDLDLQSIRGNLANTLQILGDLDGARALFEGILEALEPKVADDHPHLLSARENLADVVASAGDFPRAEALQRQVLETRSRLLPSDHPALQKARERLACLLASLGQTEESVELGRRLAQDLAEAVPRWMLSLSPREMEAWVEQFRSVVGTVLSTSLWGGAGSPRAPLDRETFSLVEGLRSVGLRSARILRASARSADSAQLVAAARTASADLARLVSAGADRDEIAKARGSREAAEKAILRAAAGTPEVGESLAAPSAEALAARLAPKDALVGYWRYTRVSVDPVERRGRADRSEALCAFVVRPGGSIARIELGPLDPVEKAVGRWRVELLGSPPDAADRGEGVSPSSERPPSDSSAGLEASRLLLAPLQRALGGAERIVLALDGALHAIPFDALPDVAESPEASPRGRLLGDRMRVEVRSTLDEMLDDSKPRLGDEVLLVGGIDFDAEPALFDEDAATPTAAVARGSAGAPGYLRSGNLLAFAPLPGSDREVQAILGLRRAAPDGEGRVRLLTGATASRASLETLAPRARWIHLATHGWFAPESVPCASEPEVDLSKPGALSRREQVERASPLVLCGLALAGANLPKDAFGCVPGMITAEELSTMDLSGCEMVVLSACETNVGVRRAGHGVASLQRAVQMAGARSVVTSLWKVPDEATRELMVDFYRRLWIGKEPKAKALWEAKARLRAARDEHGKPRYSTRDWAAWILTGDPR